MTALIWFLSPAAAAGKTLAELRTDEDLRVLETRYGLWVVAFHRISERTCKDKEKNARKTRSNGKTYHSFSSAGPAPAPALVNLQHTKVQMTVPLLLVCLDRRWRAYPCNGKDQEEDGKRRKVDDPAR